VPWLCTTIGISAAPRLPQHPAEPTRRRSGADPHLAADDAKESCPALATEQSASWDLYTSLRAIGSEQGKGDRRDPGVADVADRGPGIPSQPGNDDIIRDAAERRNIRDTSVARDVAPELLARTETRECAGRRRGAVLVRLSCRGRAAANGQRSGGRGQERSH
jgi:hypothetical protein